MSLDKNLYEPGRFQYLWEKDFSSDIWKFLTSESSIQSMINATSQGKAAITDLLYDIEIKFGEQLNSSDYSGDDVAVFINNMIKQIMLHRGYEHIGCGLCSQAKFFNSSGLYKKQCNIQ
jgi:hypothetical protein